MKEKIQKLLVAAVAMMVAGAANADVVYHELFTTEDQSADDTLLKQGWASHEGTTGTVWTYPKASAGSSGGTAWDGGPVNSNPLNTTDGDGGYIYAYAHADKDSFFHTDEYSFDMASWENLKFTMRHNSNRADDVRAAIDVGGSWYVSDAVTISAHAGWAGAKMWEVEATNTTWYALAFVEGSSMTIGASTTLPSTGTVDGFGFYVDSQSASDSIRYDNYMIQADAIPEPATLGLFAGAFGLLAFIRRRFV